MAAVGREEYIKLGEEHMRNDVEVTREECTNIQSTLNGHVAALIKIFEMGSDWGHMDRHRKTCMNMDASVAPIYTMLKDHKEMKDGLHRTRPVVSGESSMNVHTAYEQHP